MTPHSSSPSRLTLALAARVLLWVALVAALPDARALECKTGVEPLDVNASASSCAACTWHETCALPETRCLAYSVHDGTRLVRVYQCDTVDGCRQVRALQHRDYMCCSTDMCTGGAPPGREEQTVETEDAGSVLVLVLALVLAVMAGLIVLAYRCAGGEDAPTRAGRRHRGALV